MGPGIVIPIIVLVVIVPIVLLRARSRFQQVAEGTLKFDHQLDHGPSARLTSNALRELGAPAWRVVHEIPLDRLDGVEHVLIGAPGVFAVTTSMDPLPPPPAADTPLDAMKVAEAAIVRGGLDDALRRCAMASDRMVVVHWGLDRSDRSPSTSVLPQSVDVLPGVTAVDGRQLGAWAGSLPAMLSPAQVDLAWQTVTTAIGRPDPLG